MATTILENPREIRGLEILAKADQIHRLSPDSYRVDSQNGSGSYLVTNSGREWTCECPDHQFRQTLCKHIWAVYFSLNMRHRVITTVTTQVESLPIEGCRYCGSQNVVKIGIRHNQHGNVQRLLCEDCGHKFSNNQGFEKVKATPKAITSALDCYFKGMSQRKIVEHLKNVEGIEVTQPCVLKWIRRYTELMVAYTDKFTPNVGGIWHSDEMMVNVRRTERVENGNWAWLWNLMDHETRFLLASEVTKHRELKDARKVLHAAKETAHTSPDFIVTDKLQSYREAVRKEFWTRKNPKTKHLRLKSIREGTNNNILERLNGTVRERTKAMRGLDHDESAERMLQGKRLYYNFLRPHSAIDGLTPAEKAGIHLNLKGNKWEKLIKQAKKETPKVIEEK